MVNQLSERAQELLHLATSGADLSLSKAKENGDFQEIQGAAYLYLEILDRLWYYEHQQPPPKGVNYGCENHC